MLLDSWTSRLSAMRGYKWLVLALLVLVGAMNYADRTAFTTVLPLLKKDMGMSDVALGSIGAVFLWSYGLISPFSGAMGDRFSRSAIVIFSLAAWSAVMALTGFVTSVAWLLFMRMLLGMAESFYIPSATALLGEHHDSRTRATAMGIHVSGFYLGLTAGGAFAGFLGQLHGWRFTVQCLGVAGLVLALISSGILVRKRPAPAAGAVARPARLSTRAVARTLFSTPCYWVIIGEALLMSMGTWIFFYWLPLYFTETFHLSLARAGVAGTVPSNVGGIAGLLLGGWLSDRVARKDFRKRMLWQMLFCFASIPSLIVFLLSPSLPVMYLAVFCFSFLKTMGQANESPMLCELLPQAAWSTSTGILNFANCIAGGIALLLAGVLKQRLGLSMIFASISVIMAAAGIILAVGYFGILARSKGAPEKEGTAFS
ncbi:MAG: MFS transporter [Acidobacteria bacterium]|nr:MFS transporter [Acidobacteriota bacterium]